MKNFLDQIKAIVAKEPQPDPKWAPKLIIYWTTKKMGRFIMTCPPGKGLPQQMRQNTPSGRIMTQNI